MKETKKLNLGCGKKIRKGYLNVDLKKLPGVDMTMDLNKLPYPFKKGEFEEIYCDNILEHLSDLNGVMKELHRVLKPGGRLVVKVPYFSQVGAFSDPTHKNFFTYYTMDYYCKRKKTEHYFDFGFKMRRRRITFLYEYHGGVTKIILFLVYLLPLIVYSISPWLYSWFLSHIFPGSEIHFEMQK